MSADVVLVTGGSGFIAQHCMLRLLKSGYRVRTTLRSPNREPEVRAALKQGGQEAGDRLEFATADLTSDNGWAQAATGCRYLLHVASPLPPSMPKDENELIVPARDGALRALRAARDAGVERAVLTSSFAAIGYGNVPAGGVYTEADWTDTSKPIAAYTKSKAIAERAAWDFIAREGGSLQLATVNPVVVFGPALTADLSASTLLISRMLAGRVPAWPRMSVGIVDVRDVADLHILAMINSQANGQRFMCAADEPMLLRDIARLLSDRMGHDGRKVATRQMPDWLVRLGGKFSPLLRATVPELGRPKTTSNAKARQLLGWQPRSSQEAVLAAARSLVELGVAGVGR
ncbi:MAG: aldehyde reductase [Mesorhizobium sp.]